MQLLLFSRPPVRHRLPGNGFKECGVIFGVHMLTKYLGMNLDAKLRWKGHIKEQRDELNIKFKKIYWSL
jgi:hypothetical protein